MRERAVLLLVAAVLVAGCFLNHPPPGGWLPSPTTTTMVPASPLPTFPPSASVPPPPSTAPSPIDSCPCPPGQSCVFEAGDTIGHCEGPKSDPSPSPVCPPGTHLHYFSQDPPSAMCVPDDPPASPSPKPSPKPSPPATHEPPKVKQIGGPGVLHPGQSALLLCEGASHGWPVSEFSYASGRFPPKWVEKAPFKTPIPPGRKPGHWEMGGFCLAYDKPEQPGDYRAKHEAPNLLRLVVLPGARNSCSLVAYCLLRESSDPTHVTSETFRITVSVP